MRRIFAIAFALVALTACNRFLNTTPSDRISESLAWQKQEYTDLYINHFYAYIERYGQYGGGQFSSYLTEGLTTTLKYNSPIAGTGDPNNYVFYPDRINTNQNLLNIWDVTYERIRRVNLFLDAKDRYSVYSEDVNRLYEAQARFFRAFLYFQLARRHGGVILYKDMNLVKDKNRATAKETWDLIEQDLDFAAEFLPDTWEGADKGRITRLMALALKSRAMLYAERWQSAYDAAGEVMKSGVYDLVDDYAQATKGSNKEAILQFQYQYTGGLYHNFDRFYAPYGDFTVNGNPEIGGWASPTQEMVEIYEKADGTKMDWTPWHGKTTTPPPYSDLEKRFKATILYPGAMWKNRVMECSETGNNGRFVSYGESPTNGRTTTGYYLRKLLDESNTELKSNTCDQTWVELRYAEVLLNHAEAAYRLGKSEDAVNDLNAIRARADLPGRGALTGDALFEAIRHERTVELAYEGQLWWDMRRWRLAHTAYSGCRVHGIKISGAPATYEYIDADGQDRSFPERLYVLPIPDTELFNNSAIEQYDEWK